MRNHGGTIELSSSSPLGSNFRISLPIHRGENADSPHVDVNPQGAPPTTILLVDDNVSGLETMKLLLELEGHTVVAATSAKEGIRLFEKHTPKVVILDLGLPDMSGRDLARTLRASPAGTDTLLIALTGRGSESDAAISLESGFDAHLIKPAHVGEIISLIAEYDTKFDQPRS